MSYTEELIPCPHHCENLKMLITGLHCNFILCNLCDFQ